MDLKRFVVFMMMVRQANKSRREVCAR